MRSMEHANTEEMGGFHLVDSGTEIFKARGERAPSKHRVAFFKASTELPDYENEIVTSQAIQKASKYFLAKGYIDWDHWSIPARFPAAMAKAGFSPLDFRIGRPEEFKTSGSQSFIKARIHNTGKIADGAWRIIQEEPGRLNASVGGGYLKRKREFHKSKGRFMNTVTDIHWNHLAVCPEGINSETSVSPVPFGAFMKGLIQSSYECPPDCPATDCDNCINFVMPGALGKSFAHGGKCSHEAQLARTSQLSKREMFEHIAKCLGYSRDIANRIVMAGIIKMNNRRL